MKQKTARILSLSILIILFASLFSWSTPVSAGVSEWTAETIPSRLDNTIGPPGIDVRDYSIADDDTTIYAVPGDSITDNVVYKSYNAGVSWEALSVSFRADLVAVAPDNSAIAVIANNSTPEVNLTIDGGATWYSLGTPQAGGVAAAALLDLSISGIRANKHYIAAAGKDTLNAGNLWYFVYGSTTPTWQQTNTLPGAVPDNEIAAIAFSYGFSSDVTLVAITSAIGVGVKLQLLDFASLTWNSNAGYTGYPCNVVSDAGFNRLTSASLALSPSYDGTDVDYRKLFIGLTIDGTAAAAALSGIYRFADTTKTGIYLNVQIHSVAFNGSYLIAGLYNSTTVYRVVTPEGSSWTVSPCATTKNPGGTNRVLVAWLGSSVVAGTGGNESAFSISQDSSNTFNDISLIDTIMVNATDVAVSADGSKVYMVTDDGFDVSLWGKASAWKRVFSLQGATNFIVRVERQSGNIVYLAQKGSMTIYYNNNGGGSHWLTRMCNIGIEDIAVESTQIIYVLNTAGRVSKSVNGGSIWIQDTETTLSSGGMLTSIGAGQLLAGSQNGWVAYSMNGSASWVQIAQPFNLGAGKIHVVADQSFATNKIIYAASETPGHNIMKWQIGTSTEWTDIFNGTITGGVYGLAIDSNTLYVLEYSTATQQSTLWRFISPLYATSTSEGWTDIAAVPTLSDPTIRFNATPQGLKASSGKMWAVNTNGVYKLYSFNDFAVNITLTLLKPETGFSGRINAFTAAAFDIPFSWERPSIATEYELRISLDPAFSSLVASVTVNTSEEVAFVMLGPGQTGTRRVIFSPGSTYYWKIRTTKPGYSLYSATKVFTIEASLAAGSQMLVPGNGNTVTSTTPAFSWQPLSGATEYEFMLSDNVTMSSPLLDAKVDGAGIQLAMQLERGKTYFWRVRAIRPVMSEWSALAIFVVAEEQEEPVPAVLTRDSLPIVIEIPENPPQNIIKIAPSVKPPPPVAPDYLRGIIIVMSVLTVVVIVLIFVRIPERFLATAPLPKRLIGPFRMPKLPERKPAVPKEKPVTPREKPAIPLEKPVIPRERPVVQRERQAPPAAPRERVKPTVEKERRPPVVEKSKEAEAVIFAVKSFIWMATPEKATAESQPELSIKERDTLGKKLAERIKELAKKEQLFIRYPEDAAVLLRIWARYGSKDETNAYLVKSFKVRPENAIRLIKCFLPSTTTPEAGDTSMEFTRDGYQSMAETVNPDKVYAALTKVFKFKLETIEETTPVKPGDRNIAFSFMRVHHQTKSSK